MKKFLAYYKKTYHKNISNINEESQEILYTLNHKNKPSKNDQKIEIYSNDIQEKNVKYIKKNVRYKSDKNCCDMINPLFLHIYKHKFTISAHIYKVMIILRIYRDDDPKTLLSISK